MTDRSIAFVRTEEAPQLPPPPGQSGIGSWLWRNMFASMSNFSTPGAAVQSLLMILATVVVGYFGVTQLIGLVKFGLLDAVWSAPEGVKREACSTVAQGGPQPEGWYGACYPYVAAKWQFFMYGFYPTEELWRVNIVYLLGSIGVAWLTMSAVPARRGVGFALIASGVALAAYVSAIATDGFDAA
ncbi:MAG: amino acid ABC transporter permease, partial [Pseudomonadota bacterium]